MLSISAICAARSAPIAKPLLSLKAGAAAGAVAAPAGEGVAGTPPLNKFDGIGAAGAAGVDAATAGAGVAGGFEVEAAGVGAGAVLGWDGVRHQQT